MTEYAACPEPGCGLPAEVVDIYDLYSTGAPVRIVATACVNRHNLTTPEEASDAAP